jgi:hypothetical protein
MRWFRRQTQPEETPAPRKRQGLNGHQRRALNSTLAHLERQLLHLEHLLHTDDHGILVQRTGQLSPATRQQLFTLFGQLRQEISALAVSQALPGAEENMRARLIGTTAVLWADLEDIRPQTLHRYGAVDPALEETIGPPIERLIQGVLAIEALVKAEQQSATTEHQQP